MAEPLPSASTSSQDPSSTTTGTTSEDSAPLPSNAEDRRAAAALNALDSNSHLSGTSSSADANQDALGKAMNRLDISSPAESKKEAKEKKWWQEKREREEEEAKRKKAVKVKAEDVAFLVEELEVGRARATDLLKTYEADVGRAVRGFVAPASSKPVTGVS